MMKASELVRRHIDVAKNYKTVYMWGCFGSPVGETIIDEKSAQYPDWYTGGRVTYLRSLIGKVVYGFDCVNLTKGILWGWNGNKNAYYGGARYASNSVPDVSADGMAGVSGGQGHAHRLRASQSGDDLLPQQGQQFFFRNHEGSSFLYPGESPMARNIFNLIR